MVKDANVTAQCVQGTGLRCFRHPPLCSPDAVSSLLAFHQIEHLFRRGSTDDLAAFQFFQKSNHFMRRSASKAKALVLLFLAFDALAPAENTPHQARFFEPE